MTYNNFQNIVAQILIDIESVKFSFEKPFTLTSGLKSPVYVDCRKIISFMEQRNIILNIAIKYFKEKKINFDILAGGETAGIPYASFFSQIIQKPMIYVRKKPKEFGGNQQIEGEFKKNQKVILIEDLATDGGSKIIFIEALRKAGLKVTDIFVIFYYDIFDINKSPIKFLDVKIHSLCTWRNIIEIVKLKKLYSEEKIQDLEFFLTDPDKWRSKS
jgi:orotate phosphoribosyltransferase|tara:strand:+ start:1528 stop:2175 length:648 start_codon:yes stop_codon:yes gene_type:complete